MLFLYSSLKRITISSEDVGRADKRRYRNGEPGGREELKA